MYLNTTCDLGYQQIRNWVKESFKQPPFNLVDVVDWTVPPRRSVPLVNVYTPPALSRLNLTTAERAEDVDIEDIMKCEQSDMDGPIRILFYGKIGNVNIQVLTAGF